MIVLTETQIVLISLLFKTIDPFQCFKIKFEPRICSYKKKSAFSLFFYSFSSCGEDTTDASRYVSIVCIFSLF